MSLKGWTPRYSINFYRFLRLDINNHPRDIKSMMLIDEIAKNIQAPAKDIMTAFMLWGANGYPQKYFYPTGQGTKTKGGTYEIGILIWNYQGGYHGDHALPNTMGVVSKSRTWGKGFKDLTHRESFYLGALA